MQNSNTPSKETEVDLFQLKLLEEKHKLEQCQQEKQLSSCSHCEHYLQCDIRRAYVQAVYNSMSKGETGGFEF